MWMDKPMEIGKDQAKLAIQERYFAAFIDYFILKDN